MTLAASTQRRVLIVSGLIVSWFASLAAVSADDGTAHNGPHNVPGVIRAVGIFFFRAVLRPILGKPVRDPTSGFVGVNRTALSLFSRSFPLEYPEIEALVVLQRKRFRFVEVPCSMRPRRAGRSSITALKSLYYIAHVLLGVFINVLKFEAGGRTKK